jgi:hypothetical protein
MSKIKDFITAVLAYLAGLANTLPKAKTRYQDYMAKAARAIKSGLLPQVTGEEKDHVMMVVRDEGGADPNAYKWEITPLETLGDALEEAGYGPRVPAPGEDDEGKILRAKRGQAEWVEDLFIIHLSGTTANGDAACDKTLDEIYSARNQGRRIEAVWTRNNVTLIGSIAVENVGGMDLSPNEFHIIAGYNLPQENGSMYIDAIVKKNRDGETTVTIVLYEE